MIILTNCMTPKADEGALKVACSLIRRLKKEVQDVKLWTYERPSDESDCHLKLNKLFLSCKLWRLLRKQKGQVLYAPFPTGMLPMALRVYVLSKMCRKRLTVLVSMQASPSSLGEWLLRRSKACVAVLSPRVQAYYERIGVPVLHLHTGVDTKRFQPVTAAEKQALRQKYGVPADRTVVLHVGHLKQGRNVGVFLNLPEEFHGVLVTSSFTAQEQDAKLRKALLKRQNVTLIDTYQEHIEQWYQLADVYLFPVTEAGNCIDTPLSALEAAACGVPVAATAYGELQCLMEQKGFYKIENLEEQTLHPLLAKAAREQVSPRQAVVPYDWDNAVRLLQESRKEVLG